MSRRYQKRRGRERPLLSIHILTRWKGRPRKKTYQERMIKVRMDGPTSGRWIRYARWWWEQNKGPVPAGKLVLHLDGDTLNDDPSNYGLGTAGDILAIAHMADEQRSDEWMRKACDAAAATCALRGRVNRAKDGRLVFEETVNAGELLPWRSRG